MHCITGSGLLRTALAQIQQVDMSAVAQQGVASASVSQVPAVLTTATPVASYMQIQSGSFAKHS